MKKLRCVCCQHPNLLTGFVYKPIIHLFFAILQSGAGYNETYLYTTSVCLHTTCEQLMEAISWKVTYTQVDEKTFEVPKDDTV